MNILIGPTFMLVQILYGYAMQSAEILGMPAISFMIQLILLLAAFALSTLLSGSEVSLFSLIKEKDTSSDGQNNPADKRIAKLLEQPRRLRATFLTAITSANITVALLAAHIIGGATKYAGWQPMPVLSLEVIILLLLMLILSEITPKTTAINNPSEIARKNSAFIYTVFILLKPLAVIIAKSSEQLEQLLPKASGKMTSDDFRNMTEEEEQEGSIKEEDHEIFENVIEFGTITVREIMTSRVNIVAVSVEDSLNEVLQKIRENGLSRMPLYENDLDNIIGVLYAKDVLAYLNSPDDEPSLNWKTVSRKALFIPDSKRLDDLLKDFQQEKTHIAVVVDEYGGTDGIVTMDDILEEIVGDISDDNGEDVTMYTQFKSGIYIFDAQINLDDMEEILNCEITNQDDEFETLGGLIYYLIENLPTVGERISYKNLELTVHSVQNNRIKKVRVKVDEKKETASMPTE